MCFDGGDEYEYETRVEIRNGERQLVNTYYPRYGMSRRRRYGFGGPYYPSRYYARPPSGRYTNREYAYLDRYPNVPLPQDFVRDVYPRQYSVHGYGTGYRVGARAAMPSRYSIVGFFHFPFPLIALLSAFSPLPLVHMRNYTLRPPSPGTRLCSWVPFVKSVSYIGLYLDSFLASPHCHPSVAAYPTSSLQLQRFLQRPNRFPNYHAIHHHDGGIPQASPPIHLHSSLRATRHPQLRGTSSQRRRTHRRNRWRLCLRSWLPSSCSLSTCGIQHSLLLRLHLPLPLLQPWLRLLQLIPLRLAIPPC